MLHHTPLTLRTLLYACALACLVMLATGCSTITTAWTPTTSVSPLSTDDLREPCTYEMILSGPAIPQTGVLVIFDREDSSSLYTDPAVRAMAAQLNLALVFAHQCYAASFDDLQWDATKGPGRTLFLALSQFATLTDHPELATANVLVFGFSAAGYLSMTLTNAYPSRVLGAILDAPASGYADLDNVVVSGAAAQIPLLVLANGNDTAAGTQRPFNLFARGRALGAPWGFGVQNNTGHCCTDSTRPLLVPWVTAVLQGATLPTAAGQAVLRPNLTPAPPTVAFNCVYDGWNDVVGSGDCALTDASILPANTGGVNSAWLPDATTAKAWLAWVTNPVTN